MNLTVNTSLAEYGGFDAGQVTGGGVPLQSTHLVNAPKAASNFSLADVLASQAPGKQAITATVNTSLEPFGGWLHLSSIASNPQDLASAINANYAAEHTAATETVAQAAQYFPASQNTNTPILAPSNPAPNVPITTQPITRRAMLADFLRSIFGG